MTFATFPYYVSHIIVPLIHFSETNLSFIRIYDEDVVSFGIPIRSYGIITWQYSLDQLTREKTKPMEKKREEKSIRVAALLLTIRSTIDA